MSGYRTYDKKGKINNHREAAFIRVSPTSIKDKPSHRIMIIVQSNGCEYAKKHTGGCTMCGFQNHLGDRVSEADILTQIKNTMTETDLTGVEEINLFTIGSILNDEELSSDFREKTLRYLAQFDFIKRITIEGRADYVTVEKLKECKAVVGDKILEYGIGFESQNDYIRNTVINKNLSKDDFEHVVQMAGEAGVDMYVYLLIKPFGLSEKEAIEDAYESAKYVFRTAKRYGVFTRVAFEPIFIVEHTKLEEQFLNGEYQLANLWSVVEVIKRTHGLGEVFIGLSDELLSSNRKVYSCDRCYDKIIRALENYNMTQNINGVLNLQCECKDAYLEKFPGILEAAHS